MPMPPEARPFTSADVSVVIPAWQAAATIGRALASIGTQTATPGEVIVVDDGSTDGTAAAAQAAVGLLGGIPLCVLTQTNAGAGAARNRGIEAAQGRLLAFLDADDEWLPGKLECSIERLNATDAVLVAHDGWIVDSDGTTARNETARRFMESADPFVGLYRKGFIDTCSVVACRDAVIAAGGFDETLPNAQDFELWLAMLKAPHTRFEVFAEPLVRYHRQAGSIMSHTGRRLGCCLIIARRYAPDLAGRPGGMLAPLWYRVVAIHYEALQAHRTAGRRADAIGAVLMLPIRLIGATAGVWWPKDRGGRPSYMATVR